jgi:L-seryl-tRNA(Ser) seleniumtransferase
VINATGVVLHTNLGRAILARGAVEAVEQAAEGYSNLELDLESGRRGSRYVHCVALLRELTGAEDALVVNNNAAAVVLAVNTLALRREVVVSRGELVEIGGAFRIPEIVRRSGARLVEVGATNRTHGEDYERAIGARTAALLRVHRSNFRLSGYTAQVDTPSLAALAARHGLPLLEDLGSGLLIDPALLHLPNEPTPRQVLDAGADVVTMSGDKLLGGPQAGIIAGRRTLLRRMRRNPLCRALRVDKLTLAALEATLQAYRDPTQALARIPTLRALALAPDELHARATELAQHLVAAAVPAETRPGTSAVGGGAYPEVELPTTLVAIVADLGANELAARLRGGEPPVVARIEGDRVVLDPRTIAAADAEPLVQAVRRAVAG